MKEFNTTAVCTPDKHYMVDISERVREIKKLVDAGKYFTINRARQYGKTTTLSALRKALQNDYIVVALSFEGLTKANFRDEYAFVKAFCRLIKKNRKLYLILPDSIKQQIDSYLLRQNDEAEMDKLFITLNEWCEISGKPIVMFIDEVDKPSDNQIFLDFLGLLREGYISRETDGIPTFHSVILAGVTDVKHLKGKIRPDANHKLNSPWNIAADFDIDMSLSKDGIKGMLDEYEADHHTGMDTAQIAKEIRSYTNGYPFLVSRICQLIDTKLVPSLFKTLTDAWTIAGVDEAVRLILSDPLTAEPRASCNRSPKPKTNRNDNGR